MVFDINVAVLLANNPTWLTFFSTIIQSLGIIVASMISYLGFKAYRLTKDKKYKYFFYGFFFLAASFLANVILNVLIRLGYAKYFVENRYTLYVAPLFLIYYFFLIGMMLAYTSLSIVYSNVKHNSMIWMFYFWTFAVGIYSFRNSLLFNVFCAILMSFVVMLTFEKFWKTKKNPQLSIFLSFLALFVFHALVMIEQYSRIITVVRYLILLAGLILLLVTMLKIYGRTKK